MDSLVFETLIPKPMMQHYISLLLKHRRLILSGPSGTGKTYLTNRLAEYLVERSGRDVTEGIVSTFNMHQQSCKVTARSNQKCSCWYWCCGPHWQPCHSPMCDAWPVHCRTCSCTSPTWPIRSTGRQAWRTCRW